MDRPDSILMGDALIWIGLIAVVVIIGGVILGLWVEKKCSGPRPHQP